MWGADWEQGEAMNNARMESEEKERARAKRGADTGVEEMEKCHKISRPIHIVAVAMASPDAEALDVEKRKKEKKKDKEKRREKKGKEAQRGTPRDGSKKCFF